MFKKILIANRGEIACRVIRTARRMGIKTVAVYSDADARAPHVKMADESVRLGPPPASRILPQGRADHRRLQGDRRRGGAPGLRLPQSERESFAKALAKAGITFIGPPPKAIAAMGDKIESKKLAQKAGVNIVPGYLDDIATTAEAVKIAERHRLSGDDEGLGRRRRQGHAPRVEREGRARGLREREARGLEQLRRRPRVHREVHRGAAPYRDPGARRPARQHPLSERARMLDPAPQPEGGRGSAVAVRLARDAQGDGRAGGRAGAGGRLLFRGHGRADRQRRRPQRQELLLPRDEHPAAGRASGDRGDHRPRPRRADDPRRGGREAEVHAG